MLGTFLKDFSQVATSQICPSCNPQPVLAAALGPLAHHSPSARPPLQPELRRLRGPKLTIGKLFLGKSSLGKSLWESIQHLSWEPKLFVCLYVCMFTCLCPINIKIAEVFGPIFCTILLKDGEDFRQVENKKSKKEMLVKIFLEINHCFRKIREIYSAKVATWKAMSKS